MLKSILILLVALAFVPAAYAQDGHEYSPIVEKTRKLAKKTGRSTI